MHSGVREARPSCCSRRSARRAASRLPATVTLARRGIGCGYAVTVGVSSAAGMFVGEQLIVIDTGDNQETVTLTAVNTASKPDHGDVH